MNVLEIKNLDLSFGNRVIFKNAHFAIQQGEYLAVVSGNGTGKSSFFKVILGKKIPDSQISYTMLDSKGHTIERDNLQYDQTNINDSIAYLADDDQYVLDETVSHELMIGLSNKLTKDEKMKRVDHILEMVKLAGIKNKKLRKCSSGERKLIRILQVLMIAQEKKVLLLDEPLNHLDANKIMLVNDLINVLRDKKPDLSIIVITHITWLFGVHKAFKIIDGTLVETSYVDIIKPVNDFYNIGQKEQLKSIFKEV